MTTPQFVQLVTEIGELLGITPQFSHGGEVAKLGEYDDIELHAKGQIVRRTRWLERQPNAKRIAEGMKLEAADRRGPGIRKR